MRIRRLSIACWIPKSTNTHSEFVTLIAFPLQQWLHERASVLSYTHITCLVNFGVDGECFQKLFFHCGQITEDGKVYAYIKCTQQVSGFKML